MKSMAIDLWSDVVCPWCYIGERRLERALAERPELQIERRWLPFQLQPHMPKAGLPWSSFVREKFGGWDFARTAFAQVSRAGEGEGIEFRFDRVANAPNTRDAHRLILQAREEDREWEMAEALFAAYFTHGRNLSDREELVAIATEIGLKGEKTRAFLAGEEKGREVEASQDRARRMGIQGVPFFVLNGRYAISGAQPLEVFLRALEMARAA